jgi:hypothetical protein
MFRLEEFAEREIDHLDRVYLPLRTPAGLPNSQECALQARERDATLLQTHKRTQIAIGGPSL